MHPQVSRRCRFLCCGGCHPWSSTRDRCAVAAAALTSSQRLLPCRVYLFLSRRTCSWFHGPWSQRRKLFTATATNAEYSESYVMKISKKKWRNREQTTGRAACTKVSKPREQLRLFKKSLSQRANWRKETKYFMRLGLFKEFGALPLSCAWAASLALTAGSVASCTDSFDRKNGRRYKTR